jgi:hypothetical protein
MNNSISAKTVDTSTLVDLLCYRALLQANRHGPAGQGYRYPASIQRRCW